jgi:hypothetical protein
MTPDFPGLNGAPVTRTCTVCGPANAAAPTANNDSAAKTTIRGRKRTLCTTLINGAG